MSGVHCSGSGLIYGDSTGGLAGAPSVTNAGYQGIGPGSSFAQITQRFGAPLSRAQLSAFVGVGSLQSLVQNQPGGESCAYYLDSSEPGRQAFQLCFNAGYSLADKSVLTTSAATPTASKSSSS